ncbi:uncharacterized protein LOC103481862 [Poecilia reticulata]|uniref:uncharacterized protein LOC103481862 n=1 Tax=Poecilia reticulata TaxID=8081 RepID=UPI0007EA7A6F|nr:PREDICTED: uncharacterized protein LOC103481862 [Poecilia reticulata]
MPQQCVFRNSWICLLLFSVGACVPVRKDQRVPQAGSTTSGVSVDFGSGGAGSSAGFRSAVGVSSVVDAGSDVDCSPAQDAHIFQMIADMLSLDPHSSRPLLQAHWSAPQIPQGMAASRPVNPSSLIVHTDGDYQQARDFPSDSKYTQDTFDHIPVPGTPQHPGSGSKEHQKI